jgi:hypothetical protein
MVANGEHLEMVQWLRANGCPKPIDFSENSDVSESE